MSWFHVRPIQPPGQLCYSWVVGITCVYAAVCRGMVVVVVCWVAGDIYATIVHCIPKERQQQLPYTTPYTHNPSFTIHCHRKDSTTFVSAVMMDAWARVKLAH